MMMCFSYYMRTLSVMYISFMASRYIIILAPTDMVRNTLSLFLCVSSKCVYYLSNVECRLWALSWGGRFCPTSTNEREILALSQRGLPSRHFGKNIIGWYSCMGACSVCKCVCFMCEKRPFQLSIFHCGGKLAPFLSHFLYTVYMDALMEYTRNALMC